MAKIIGKVISIGEVRSGNGKNGPWRNLTFIVELLNTTHRLTIDTFRDSIINEIRTGMVREFEFEYAATEYQGRWYDHHSLIAMRTPDLGQDKQTEQTATSDNKPTTPPPPRNAPSAQAANEDNKAVQEKEGELPF